MKKNLFLLPFMLIVLGLGFTGCASSDDDGGSGADFDASLYYTKTEVDSLITTTDDRIPAVIAAGTSGTTVTGTTYAAGDEVTVPSDAIAALVEIQVINNTGGDSYPVVSIGTAADNNAAHTFDLLDASGENVRKKLVMCFLPADPAETLNAWASSVTNLDISVTPQIYFYKRLD